MFHSFHQHIVAEISIESFDPDLHLDPYTGRGESFSDRGERMPVAPVAFDMDLRDLHGTAYPDDLADSIIIEIAEAAGIDDFEHTISACDVTQRLPADFKVCLFIAREVQMIVAKPAAPPLAAASSQEHYLSGIFIVYRVISLHFHVKSSFLRRGPAMRQFRRGFDAAALRQLFAHLLPIALRHGSL